MHADPLTDIQDYIKYIIEKHETVTAIPPIQVFINRFNNSIQNEFRLELQTT